MAPYVKSLVHQDMLNDLFFISFRYPGRKEMEIFAEKYSMQSKQVRTRIVNLRRARQKKTKNLKERLQIDK